MNNLPKNIEIEVRFLEVDVSLITDKLRQLKAEDRGEDLFNEVIFYDKALTWMKPPPDIRVRLRSTSAGTFLAYKRNDTFTASSTQEIEVKVDDFKKTQLLLESIGLISYRQQQKRRHTYVLGEVTVDIDTWPKIPTYVEIEGPTESDLKVTAKKLGLNWSNAVFETPGMIISKRYGIPIYQLRYFTFDKVE